MCRINLQSTLARCPKLTPGLCDGCLDHNSDSHSIRRQVSLLVASFRFPLPRTEFCLTGLAKTLGRERYLKYQPTLLHFPTMGRSILLHIDFEASKSLPYTCMMVGEGMNGLMCGGGLEVILRFPISEAIRSPRFYRVCHTILYDCFERSPHGGCRIVHVAGWGSICKMAACWQAALELIRLEIDAGQDTGEKWQDQKQSVRSP
ncbi:hypothetical protein F5Y15DRAFT_15080 [Xylariaceae sp. FL0016]|nr:hypothetical protein F5Y15DRAFT_15080 [Xylariaceae sp. FL0016]